MTLGELGHWFGGGTPSKARADFWTDGNIPWVSPKDMKTPKIQDAQDHITKAAVKGSSTSLVPSGSVLVVVRSGILKHTLPVAITERVVALNQDLKAITPKEDILPEYLALGLKAFERKILDECCKDGTTVQNIKMPSFLRFELPIAPLPEQRRIVARIEELFSRLDAGVAALRHAKAQLQRYRQSVLAAAVTGQLTQAWREQHPDTEPASELLERILEQRRKQWSAKGKYKEPKGPKLDEAHEVPEGWQIASIDQICMNYDGQRVPLKRADRDQRPGEFPYYGASGVIDDIDDFLFDGDYLLVAEDGANLLSRSTPIAFQAHEKFWVNNHAHIIQARAKIPLSYVELVFNGKDITRFVSGSAQPKLTQENLNQIPVPLPPLAEQHQIVAEVEARTTAIDHLAAELDRQITRSNRLRQSVLSDAFSGRLSA